MKKMEEEKEKEKGKIWFASILDLIIQISESSDSACPGAFFVLILLHIFNENIVLED